MTERTGSYPFKYIAEDFGLPYSTVLCYAEDCYQIMFCTPPTLTVWGAMAADLVRKSIHPVNRNQFNKSIMKENSILYAARNRVA